MDASTSWAEPTSAQTEMSMRDRTRRLKLDFWRGVLVGFISAFPIFDMALNQAAVTRAGFQVFGLQFF